MERPRSVASVIVRPMKTTLDLDRLLVNHWSDHLQNPVPLQCCSESPAANPSTVSKALTRARKKSCMSRVPVGVVRGSGCGTPPRTESPLSFTRSQFKQRINDSQV